MRTLKTRARILFVGLALVAAASAWSFVRAPARESVRLSRVHRMRRLASRSHVPHIRDRYGTYYRLADDLAGATLAMDRTMMRRDGWALGGLGLEVSGDARRIILPRRDAAPLLEGATYRTRLARQDLYVLLDAEERDYVLARTGERSRDALLIAPVARFLEAGGTLP